RQAGLSYSDITPVFLTPPDAVAAFQNGSLDAWAIWDPYLAAAELKLAPRILLTAEGLAPGNSIYVAGRDFAARYPALVLEILEEI
ncbi:hypothetical protein ACQ10I_18425, partial [Enterococcus faecalis]